VRPRLRLLLLVAVGLGLLLAAFLRPPPPQGQYQGRVVDAATKAPIEGAVVAVIWLTNPWIYIDAVGAFHEAREGLTDSEGRFSIDATPRRNWNPFRGIRNQPEIIVFKPGYGGYPDMYGTVSWPDRKPIRAIEEPLQERKPATVELPRLTSRADLERFASPSLHPAVPADAVPVYRRLINEHRALLGFPPLRTPAELGSK
jgi:hypothetical protein